MLQLRSEYIVHLINCLREPDCSSEDLDTAVALYWLDVR